MNRHERRGAKKKLAAVEQSKPLKLDLGCGGTRHEDFVCIDINRNSKADIFHDLLTPWPFMDNSVDEVWSAHLFEHFTGAERIKFMDELWRVLKAGAKATIITPYWNSMRAIQDPFHAWPPVCEHTYFYFNKAWMKDNFLEHYGVKADFDFSWGYMLDAEVQLRNQEYQQFALKHYTNVALDLWVTLVKRP